VPVIRSFRLIVQCVPFARLAAATAAINIQCDRQYNVLQLSAAIFSCSFQRPAARKTFTTRDLSVTWRRSFNPLIYNLKPLKALRRLAQVYLRRGAAVAGDKQLVRVGDVVIAVIRCWMVFNDWWLQIHFYVRSFNRCIGQYYTSGHATLATVYAEKPNTTIWQISSLEYIDINVCRSCVRT
jgi:hypothetical protein